MAHGIRRAKNPGFDEFEVEGAASTLKQAEIIKKTKRKLFAAAKRKLAIEDAAIYYFYT